VLKILKQELQGNPDAGAKFLAMWECERTMMEAGHREWLGLMIEADWFGQPLAGGVVGAGAG
jgi:hypothetical protein